MESEKYTQFVAALETLCLKHGVQIATAARDGLQVWDMVDRDAPIRVGGTEDMTGKEWIG